MKQKDIQQLFVDALKSEGIKLTPQRQAVFSNIMNSEGHRECGDIHDSISKEGIFVMASAKVIPILSEFRSSN